MEGALAEADFYFGRLSGTCSLNICLNFYEEVNDEWKEEVITPRCLGGTLFLILNLVRPYILVACKIILVARMEWNYGILGRHMSSEMTARYCK